MNQTSDAAGFSLRAGFVSGVQTDRDGANSVERINGEGTAGTGESDAEETTMTTLAGSNHTFLKKIFFTERTKV